MDPLQWMGAVKMRDQTSHKNITIILSVWTLILTAPIHCRGYIGEQVMQLDSLNVGFNAKFLQICSNTELKLIYILDGLRMSTF